MNAFPVQAAKVQPPPLRDDILARDRLLDWLHAKIHQRLVLVLAEAGYGKTTLLADFAARTRLRTLWYRLDEDDRDWVTVMHHLVAAGREHDPDFAPRTASLLADTGVAGPARDAVLNAYLRELPAIAEHGVVLILDDFHLVDEAPDAKAIVRELVSRAPERVSIVIASRRPPSVPIARLRAAGEVAELRTDDLRFDADETARLFSETYGRSLEPDVLRDLSARTEGWAASLQLVQAALRDRSPLEIRRFVRNLSGADQELYDYLAEEVIGDLPDDLQQFLMRTSILQVVTPELAAVVTSLPAADVRRLTTQAERYSLLSRRGSVQRDHLRYHPLVRDFLEDRLEREAGGRDAIAALHRTVAEASEAGDWRTACYHYSLIGDTAAIGRTIDGAVEEIIASGEVAVVAPYLSTGALEGQFTSHEVLRSRADARVGLSRRALHRAQAIAESNPESVLALTNLASMAFMDGDADLAWATAQRLANSSDSDRSEIGQGWAALVEASVDADLRKTIDLLTRIRVAQHARGHGHHEAITLINLALHYKLRGDAVSTLRDARAAMSLLANDPTGAEMASARAVTAWALAHQGDLEAARDLHRLALAEANEGSRVEVLLEGAEIELLYGSAKRAVDLRDEAAPLVATTPWIKPFANVMDAAIALREQRLDLAGSIVEDFRVGEFSIGAGLKAQQLALRAQWSLLSTRPEANAAIRVAIEHAESQGADFWLEIDRLLLGMAKGRSALNREVRRLSEGSSVYFGALAEPFVERLADLEPEEFACVRLEMERRPERWLTALRDALTNGSESAGRAAQCLDVIGSADDVPLLRRFSKRRAAERDLGKGLARRVAEKVFVEDQGRVAIKIGARRVEGTQIRRKVLTLLCFLLSRPRFSSTRDEVLEALWPEFEPTVALNSLNQTIYFLRRVFEPSYREDTSPGYVRHESDLVWLDRQLVSSRTQLCADFVRSLTPNPSSDEVQLLLSMYRGQFALDFAYEDWAVAHRETLHASYLQIIERSVASDMATGHWDRGIVTARLALGVDHEAEQIEASLVRLLRLSGAHAAAAEQYEHYSSVLKEALGIEPPPLDAL